MRPLRGARMLAASALVVCASGVLWAGAAHADCPASDPNCMGGMPPSPSPTPAPVSRGVSPTTAVPSARQTPTQTAVQPGTDFLPPSGGPGSDFAPAGVPTAPANTPTVQLAGNAVPAGGGTAGLVGPPSTSSGGSAAPAAAAALGLLGLGAAAAAAATKKKPAPPPALPAPPPPDPQCAICGEWARRYARQIEYWNDELAAYKYNVANNKVTPYPWVEPQLNEELQKTEANAKRNQEMFARSGCGDNPFLYGIEGDPQYRAEAGGTFARTEGMHWVGDHWEDYRWPGQPMGEPGGAPV